MNILLAQNMSLPAKGSSNFLFVDVTHLEYFLVIGLDRGDLGAQANPYILHFPLGVF